MGLFSLIKKERKRKNDLRELALKKLAKIEREKQGTEKIEDLIFLFKIYLENKIGIKNNKTNEEIIDIFKHKKFKTSIRNRIIALLKLLNEIEYSQKELDKKQIEMIISEIKRIIKEF